MSTISPSFSSNAFQARTPAIAFGGAGNTSQTNAHFSGTQLMTSIVPALMDSMTKPKHTGRLNYFA